ncbi:ribonuclease D [Litoribrevibacter albus]|uniref:Ribonuclease D n=1 Tax=Litoribrevibacter albus TaxID=1473156 RepID=A0AA37S817_9GAMM|nr:HRDC domain-containing protein [Litoribrevibacter albus]GLQ30032.1 ribonuclease D [Litoribrevibacter albus]
MESTKIANHQVNFVSDSDQLQGLVDHWMNLKWVALDTEFVRRDTYRAIPALIQVYDGQDVWLIDPESPVDLTIMADFIESDCIKVLHSAAEDLGVLYRATGAWLRNLCDSQLALALLNQGQTVGYQKMISSLLNIELSKDETKSDWLLRPLTDQQIQYAAEDVIYLAQAWEMLEAQLIDMNRLSWLKEDSQDLVDRSRALYEMDGDLAFQRVKGTGKLNSRSLAVVRALAIWRERLAAEKDIPKGRILADAQIVEIALRKATSRVVLDQLAVPKGIIRNYGVLIGELVRGAMALEESQLPERYQLLPKDAKSWLEAIYKPVKKVAAGLNLDAEVLCRKKQFQYLVNKAFRYQEVVDWPEDISGWRRELIEDDVMLVLKQLMSEGVTKE